MDINNLTKKFVSFFYGSFITLIIGFLTTPIITRIFSPEEYGKFSMFNLVTNIGMIVVIAGIDQSFVRFFYEEQENSRTGLLYKCLIVPFIISFIISIVLLVFYKPISMYLFDECSFEVILLTVVHTIFLFVNRFSVLVVRMQQKGRLFSVLQIVQKVFYLISIYLLVYSVSNNYLILVYATIFSNLLVTIFAIVREKRFWHYRKVTNDSTKNTVNDIVKYGVPLTFTFLVTWLFQSVDRIAIKKWGTLEDVGLYAAAFSIISLLNALQTAFTTFWVPVAYEHYEARPDDTGFFQKITEIISVVMFLIGILMLLFKDIVIFLLGTNYREAMYIMPFMIFMPIMYTISETTVLGISFKKKPSLHLYISVLVCILNIIGNLILVPLIGAKGASISTGLSYIVFFALRTYFSNKLYRVNYDLIKIYVMTFLLVLYSLYATFYSINIYYIMFGVAELIVLSILYRRCFRSFYKKALEFLKSYRSVNEI